MKNLSLNFLSFWKKPYIKNHYIPTHENPTLLKYIELISNDNLYKNSKLSLTLVADKLEVTPQYLSKIINEVFNKSFSEYINSYRIEEVKKMLLNPDFDKYSILAIGYEAGFNSKSVFYSTFKKQIGITPKQFKDQNRFEFNL